jgi:hypothetical protein
MTPQKRQVRRAFINRKLVRELARSQGRRVGRSFMYALEDFVRRKIDQACKVHNGGKVTLDSSVAGYVGIKV